MGDKPKFNPNQSYEAVDVAEKPAFNPDAPYEEVKKKELTEPTQPFIAPLTNGGQEPKVSAYAPNTPLQSDSADGTSEPTPSTSDLLKSQPKANSQQLLEAGTQQVFNTNPIFMDVKPDGSPNPNAKKNRQVFLQHTNQATPINSETSNQWSVLQPIADLSNKYIEATKGAFMEGNKQVNEAVAEVPEKAGELATKGLDADLAHPVLKGTLGTITAVASPVIAAFNLATEGIAKNAEKTLPEKQAKIVGEALPYTFSLAHKAAASLGYTPETDSNGDMLLSFVDFIIGGKALEIGGKVIKNIKDLKSVTEKAAKGELTPTEQTEYESGIEKLKTATMQDAKVGAEQSNTPQGDKIAKDINALEEQAKPKEDIELNKLNDEHAAWLNADVAPELKDQKVQETAQAIEKYQSDKIAKGEHVATIDNGIATIKEDLQKPNNDHPAIQEDLNNKLQGLENQKKQLQPKIKNEPTSIFHGTTADIAKEIESKGFDVEKGADGTMWFTNNKSKIEKGEVGASVKGGIVERTIDESGLKLGGYDEQDKYSTGELINMGYDGLKLVDKDEVTYQIFEPNKLKKLVNEPTNEVTPQGENNPNGEGVSGDVASDKTMAEGSESTTEGQIQTPTGEEIKPQLQIQFPELIEINTHIEDGTITKQQADSFAESEPSTETIENLESKEEGASEVGQLESVIAEADNLIPKPPIEQEGQQESLGGATGVSAKAREARAQELGTDTAEAGEGWTGKEALDRGRELLNEGADPIKMIDDNNIELHDKVAIAQAHSYELGKETDLAKEKYGKESPEYKQALKAEDDYAHQTKKLSTKSHKAFAAHQGAIELNTGSWTELERTFKERTGKEFSPEQVKEAKELVAKLKEQDLKIADLEKKYTEAMDKWVSEQEAP